MVYRSHREAWLRGYLRLAMGQELFAGDFAVDPVGGVDGAEFISTDPTRNITPSSELDTIHQLRDIEPMVVIWRQGLVYLPIFEFIVETFILFLSDLYFGQHEGAERDNMSVDPGCGDATGPINATTGMVDVVDGSNGGLGAIPEERTGFTG